MRWLGIDGGGTKTSFVTFDEDMGVIANLRLPSCHIAQAGERGMASVLGEGISWAMREGGLGEEWGIGFGLAGYGEEPLSRAKVEGVCERVALGHPYALLSDLEAGCSAALALADGVVMVAGTGSAALGMRGELSLRCGGWGCQIGDEGSGWWMGRRLLQAFSRQADGRSPRGTLYQLVRKHLGLVSDYDLIALRRGSLVGRSEVAALAPLVFEAADGGDPEASHILDEAAAADAEMASTVVRGLFPDASEVRTSYVGGTFLGGGGTILRMLPKLLPPVCRLAEPVFEPAAGACLVLRRSLEGGDACMRGAV